MLHGAEAVAGMFKGRAQAARLAFADGAPALAVILDGELRIVVRFTIENDRIVAIDGCADPERVRHMQVNIVDA